MNRRHKTVALIVAGLTATASMSSYAATDINVSGMINPPGCTAELSSGNDLRWDPIAQSSLSANAYTTLASQRAVLQVSCPATTSIAIWMVDPNQASAMAGQDTASRTGHAWTDRAFGIGFDPVTQQPIGNFTVNPVQTTVDGVANTETFGYQGSGAHNGTSFSVVKNAKWAYKKTEDWTPVDAASNSPAKGQSFTWAFDIEPQLNKAANITNAVQVPWAGTAQINVRYF